MRIIDLLTEAVSSVVYHYTNLDAAARILTTGQFALSSTLGSIEEKFAPKGLPYFLSTTRTRRGGYHANSVGDGAAMFNLDGNYYNQRYKGGPIDYWGDRHNDYGRAAEAEDRIFSKEPTMPASGITSVHIFVKPMDAKERERWGNANAARARMALLAAKKAGIPAYLYEDRTGWVNQDPKARIAITGSRDTLRGQVPMYNPSHPPRQYMAKWLELMYKDSTAALSKQNASDLHSLVYDDPYWLKEMVTSLAGDLSNARKPSAGADREVAVKIISYMNRHGLHTVTDFIMALRNKWTLITNKEKEATAPELAESTNPKSASPDEIFDYIESIHTGPGLHDTNDDELSTEEWVHQFDSFELQPVDLSTLALKASSNKQAKIDQYAQSKEEFPPIVIDGSSDWIIDGYHRANAAAQRGDTTIMAYVGAGR